MKTVKELRQERAEKIAGMTRLNVAAEGEERDLTEAEKVEYDGLKTAAALLAERIARLEEAQELEEDVTRSQGTKAQGETRGKAPAYNKMPLGDSETRAFAHWIKTGDDGGIRELRASNATDMNIGTAADGQYLVPTGHYNQVIARRDEAMLANQIGVMNIPGQGTTVNVPVDNEADGEFVSTNEASEFDLDAPATAQVAMTLVKYTKQIKISYELLEDEDAKLLSFLSDFVGRGMAKTHNSLLLTEARAGGTAALTLDSASTIGDGEPVELLYKQPAEYLDGSGVDHGPRDRRGDSRQPGRSVPVQPESERQRPRPAGDSGLSGLQLGGRFGHRRQRQVGHLRQLPLHGYARSAGDHLPARPVRAGPPGPGAAAVLLPHGLQDAAGGSDPVRDAPDRLA
jgi:HK97 family phage major capsid protein